MRRFAGIGPGLAIALLAGATALASGPTLSTPAKAHVGQVVTAKASGLKAGRYALTLVSDDHPGRTAACVARMGRSHRAEAGKVRLRGRIPGKLTCWENNSVHLGRVDVTPGAYHLIVGVPDGPAGFNVRNSFVRRKLAIEP